MRKILRGEGILPLLFTTYGRATYKPEGIRACLGVNHA